MQSRDEILFKKATSTPASLFRLFFGFVSLSFFLILQLLFVAFGSMLHALCVCVSACVRGPAFHCICVLVFFVSCDEKTAYIVRLWSSGVTERNLISVYTRTSCTIVENIHFCQHPFRAKHIFPFCCCCCCIDQLWQWNVMCGWYNGATTDSLNVD